MLDLTICERGTILLGDGKPEGRATFEMPVWHSYNVNPRSQERGSGRVGRSGQELPVNGN